MAEMREALVFDYDGVIADTEPLHWKSWAALLLTFGVELGWEEYCEFGLGIGDAQIYEQFRKRAPLPDANEFSRLNLERKERVREWSMKDIPISHETVALLKALGCRQVGLVTSSGRLEIEPVLRAAAVYDQFSAMVFGEDVERSKPSPEPYLLIAQRLGVQTGIAFEDSESGLESARAAGFRAVKIDRPGDLAETVARWLR